MASASARTRAGSRSAPAACDTIRRRGAHICRRACAPLTRTTDDGQSSTDRPEDSARFLAARRPEEREPACARAQDRDTRGRSGSLLFKEGDTDKRTYYLVDGTVDLLDGRQDSRHDQAAARQTQSTRSRPSCPGDAARAWPPTGSVPVDRQRPARRADHLGPDRPVRSRRPARRSAPRTMTG